MAGLDGGQFGEVASYLPGRTVAGVVVSGGRVLVQVRSRWGVPAPVLATTITRALRPVTGDRPVDVVIGDIDDPLRHARSKPAVPACAQDPAAGAAGPER